MYRRYYKGERDEKRTPFASWEEVQAEKANRELREAKESAASCIFRQLQDASSRLAAQASIRPLVAKESARVLFAENEDDRSDSSEVYAKGIWQFQDDNDKWVNYLNGHQIQLESAYQQDKNGVTTIETFPWTYAVDFSVNLQTNLDHPERRTRKIRRIHIGHLDESHRNLSSSGSFRFSTRCSSSSRRLLHPEVIAEQALEEDGEDGDDDDPNLAGKD
jgi:lipopolysaccharide export LptBFGC system permease protein LptF